VSVLAQRPANISRDFLIQGRRAIDAIQRMSGPYSASHKDSNTDILLIDSKKATDEAKYVATTPRDKYVLHALEMAVLSFDDQLSQDIGTPAWKKDVHRALQCETEAIYALTPDQLSDAGKANARLETCNKATDEWDAGITR
jgi:hypothetical protein